LPGDFCAGDVVARCDFGYASEIEDCAARGSSCGNSANTGLAVCL
jgi:hypothetical protein